MTEKVAVIGAGVAGLACAALLANKKYHVTVYEKNADYGGKLGLIKVGGSYFDTGPSLGTEPLVIDSVYRQCNRNPRYYWNYKPTKEVTRYFWEDGTEYIMPNGTSQIQDSLVEAFSVNQKKVKKYFKIMTYQYKVVAPNYLDKPFNPVSLDTVKIADKLLKALPLMLQNAHSYNSRFIDDYRATQIFDRYATYSGSDPYRGPALLNFAGGPELIDGIFYPKGGMRAIASGLFNLCQDLGVVFEFNHNIQSIKKSVNGGYKLGNIKTKYKKLIYNGDSTRLYELLNEPKKLDKLKKQERSTSGVVFYWQVKGHFKQLGLHNIIFSSNYKEEFQQLNNNVLPDEPTIYINITSKLEPKMSKPGHENWFVMINAPAGIADDTVKDLKKRVIIRLEKVLRTGLIITNESILSPKSISHRDNAYQGAIYGRSSNSTKDMLFKHPNQSAEYPNLFNVGGTVHPGGGVPLSIRSAKIVASQL